MKYLSRKWLCPAVLGFLIGCSHQEHIPVYPDMPVTEALTILNNRAQSIHSISAQGLLTLTRENGDTVRLDAAIVLQPPERARLRAWKFGRAVFDMTLTPDGLWLIAPPDSERRKEILSAGANTGELTRQWLHLITGAFDGPDTSAQDSGALLKLREGNPNGSVMYCQIDRKTLTPRRYSLKDDKGVERFTLALRRYAVVHGIAWPFEIEATSSAGRILIDLHDVEINGDLPPTAFRPPARAEKISGDGASLPGARP